MIDFSHFWDEIVKWFRNLFKKKKKITKVDFTLEPQETRVGKGKKKMADFSLTVGTHKTLVPKAFKGSDPVAFPEGSVFGWTVSDPNLELSDQAAASPELVAIGPTPDGSPATVTLTVQESGFTHTASHTVEAIAAPVDAIDTVDFDLV